MYRLPNSITNIKLCVAYLLHCIDVCMCMQIRQDLSKVLRSIHQDLTVNNNGKVSKCEWHFILLCCAMLCNFITYFIAQK